MTKRIKGQKKKRKKPSLKRAAQALARTIWKHLVLLPQEEQEKDIAAIERAVAKKFKQLRARK